MNELILTKARYLQEFERETYLHEIFTELATKNPSKKDLSADLHRQEFVLKDIESKDIINMSHYYVQNLIYVVTNILPLSAKLQSSMEASHEGVIFKKDNKIYLEHTITDPIFTFFQPDGLYQKTIPGTVKTLFSFDEHKGFDLIQVEFSNKVIFDLIKDPLHLDGCRQPGALPSNFEIDVLAEIASTLDAREPGKRVLTRERLELMANYLPDNKKRPLLKAMVEKPQRLTNIVQLLSDRTIMVDEASTHISTILVEKKLTGEKAGEEVYRTTLKDPAFKIKNFPTDSQFSFGGVIPGSVTIDYTKELSGNCRLEKVTFSHATIQRFVLNPPYLLANEHSSQKKLFLTPAEFTDLQKQAQAQEAHKKLPDLPQKTEPHEIPSPYPQQKAA